MQIVFISCSCALWGETGISPQITIFFPSCCKSEHFIFFCVLSLKPLSSIGKHVTSKGSWIEYKMLCVCFCAESDFQTGFVVYWVWIEVRKYKLREKMHLKSDTFSTCIIARLQLQFKIAIEWNFLWEQSKFTDCY